MLLAAFPEGLPENVQEYVDNQRQVGLCRRVWIIRGSEAVQESVDNK